jgi:hypothetical protein
MPGILAVPGEQGGQVVVQRELPLVGQSNDSGGGEDLGHGSDPLLGRRRGGNAHLEIGHAVALLEKDFPVLGHEGRPVELAQFVVAREERSDARGRVLRATGLYPGGADGAQGEQ